MLGRETKRTVEILHDCFALQDLLNNAIRQEQSLLD
jgi:hypothetical protein